MINVYAHFDIKADGPSFATNNMIAIGIVFTTKDGKEVDSFKRKIKAIKNRIPDEKIMKDFWFSNDDSKKRYIDFTTDADNAESVINDLAVVIHQLHSKGFKLTWIARPASFDWPWLKSYYEMFKPTFIDIKDTKMSTPDIGHKADCLSSFFKLYVLINKFNKEQENQKWEQLLYFMIKKKINIKNWRFLYLSN